MYTVAFAGRKARNAPRPSTKSSATTEADLAARIDAVWQSYLAHESTASATAALQQMDALAGEAREMQEEFLRAADRMGIERARALDLCEELHSAINVFSLDDYGA